MKVLRVNLDEKSYDIVIQKDLKDYFGEYIKTVFDGKKVAIITDDNLNDIYGEAIKKNIESEGFEVEVISVTPGEKSKSFSILPGIYNKLLDFKLTRSDLIIALDGGVVGDLAGFVASTFLRGISFIQIPTSLLAQVDSSVGGKVAVDLERGKNLVGSFYHPQLVLIDPNMLGTLPEKYFNDGLGEVIKYGCIKSKELFEKLEGFKNKEDLKENIGEIIYECCNIKRELVENDEKICGIKDFKSRKYGSVAYIDMSIFIDNNKTLEEAHNIADNLENDIISKLSYIKEINIHTEPYKG